LSRDKLPLLFAETAPGQFTCTPLGALLQTDAPYSAHHVSVLILSPVVIGPDGQK
jgi:hypothetical protein